MYCGRGNAWFGLQQNESALQDLNKAVELDPHYPSAYFSRSEFFERMSEKEHADADRETAMRLQQKIFPKGILGFSGYRACVFFNMIRKNN
ncbi:MAG: hypothetical protein CM1200mP30_25910 [Pseudomonadota bacterium]|nr:MAG: hypothetical protein CM1200mP30_25910 [Pseudomonadota bacterium]